EFKNEMKDFKDEMLEFKNEMKDFKDEMKDFKEEMKGFKEETRELQKKQNQEWGNLARKMGTIVEDIIVPAIRPVLSKYFHEEITLLSVNVRKSMKSINLKGEFDVIALGEKHVFLVEVKSTPREQYLIEFAANIEKFRKLFPEYEDFPLIPIFGSIRFEDDFIPKATQKGFYLMAYREWEYMDILNFEEVAGMKSC
uniref:hypothetical protein n=1 Tax=Desulfatirhabdium butyrativorans TaxID=340467 RepID=UPI000484A36A